MNLKKERKTMKTKTKQTARTGTESEKWTSHGEIAVGRSCLLYTSDAADDIGQV